ncbi:MAG: NUDIX hydrolase [Clostridia bacterium]|nr:NUDIX hydrolase [Clostridia bacterium]
MKTDIKKLLSRYIAYDEHNAEQFEKFCAFVDAHEIIFGKKNPDGHITASAWIVDQEFKRVLLTHHVKLNRWLQLGGHTEEHESIVDGALREAFEESGLKSIVLKSDEIFDLDVHDIPMHGKTQKHVHYDLRFLMVASRDETLSISEESHDLRWFEFDEVLRFADEASIARMVEKSRRL